MKTRRRDNRGRLPALEVGAADHFGTVANSTDPTRPQNATEQWLGLVSIIGEFRQRRWRADNTPGEVPPAQPFACFTRHDTGAVTTGCEGDKVVGAELIDNGCPGRLQPIGHCTITELALGVGTPTQHPRITHQGAGVAVAESELVDRWALTSGRGLGPHLDRLRRWRRFGLGERSGWLG